MKQPSNKIFHLKKSQIDDALNLEYRQYFIGELEKPQLLDYIEQGDLEMGTSLYQMSKPDIPHMHNETSEILYILHGIYVVLMIGEMEEHSLNAGDIFIVPPIHHMLVKHMPEHKFCLLKQVEMIRYQFLFLRKSSFG